MQIGLLLSPEIPTLRAEVNVTSASDAQPADGETIYASFEPSDAGAYHRHRH
jgi:hypothetical protein